MTYALSEDLTMSLEETIKYIDQALGDKPFVTPAQLIELSIFGSSNAVLGALRKGEIPSARISEHRIIIPKAAVLNYLRKKLSENPSETI